MNIKEGFSLAIKNIVNSKMRTLLTMLGIIIGVFAVIIIVGLGNGLSGYVEDSFSDMGTDTLTVSIMGRGQSTRTISDVEMYEIFENNSDVFSFISPTVSMNGTLKIGNEIISDTSTTGVSEEYFDIKMYEISDGRNISYLDIEERNKVCVIGEYLNTTYYGGNAIGQTLRISGEELTIIGVMAMEGSELEAGGTDDVIFMPYSTAARLSGTGTISSYSISMIDETLATQNKELLENELYNVFENSDAYRVISPAELVDTMTTMIGILVGVLAGIAAISLLVGGIGIMNIMLVSVTERTREIGIRKSLGAREKYIMNQFVIEASVISALGGTIGIVLGYILSFLASSIATALMGTTFTVDPGIGAVLLAFSISVGIGVLFGYLPAKKAAQLNPIDALRL